MISHVDITGALVYRTRKALNESDFCNNVLKHYKYAHDVVDIIDGKKEMHFWHFAGTQDEILQTIATLTKGLKRSWSIFPCLMNYQDVVETHGIGQDGLIQLDYDWAIVAQVDSTWNTQQRDRIVHKYILEPIYDELIRQVKKCGWFQLPLGYSPKLVRMKVFTTGTSLHGVIQQQYGYYIDAIQITDFRPYLRPNLCDKDIELIEREAELVTENFTTLLEQYKTV